MTLTEWLLLAILLVLMDMAGYFRLLITLSSSLFRLTIEGLPGSIPGAKFWIFLTVLGLVLIALGEMSRIGVLPQWML